MIRANSSPAGAFGVSSWGTMLAASNSTMRGGLQNTLATDRARFI
jgi:hypothetical protein